MRFPHPALALVLLLPGCLSTEVVPSPTSAITDTAEVFDGFPDDEPGCAVAVRSPAGDHADAFGVADTDTGELLTPSTIFDVGSVSKQVTAGAIATLVVDGDLDLDDDIADLLDGLPAYEDTVTLADLVHHTSGLPDYIDLLDAELDEVTTAADAREVIDDPDTVPEYEPGTAFEYSNTNYFLLAEIVESTAGESLVDYARSAIFEPLGMADSAYRDDQGDLIDGQAQGYADSEGQEPTGSAWRQTGDGAVHTTVTDLLRWADLFLHPSGGESGLGGQEWLEVMLAPGPVADDDGAGYGGGLELVDGGDTLSHGGSWIGYSSAIVMRPAQGLAVVVACNIDGLDAEGLADDVLQVWEG